MAPKEYFTPNFVSLFLTRRRRKIVFCAAATFLLERFHLLTLRAEYKNHRILAATTVSFTNTSFTYFVRVLSKRIIPGAKFVSSTSATQTSSVPDRYVGFFERKNCI